jgi:hypothetical protein
LKHLPPCGTYEQTGKWPRIMQNDEDSSGA